MCVLFNSWLNITSKPCCWLGCVFFLLKIYLPLSPQPIILAASVLLNKCSWSIALHSNTWVYRTLRLAAFWGQSQSTVWHRSVYKVDFYVYISLWHEKYSRMPSLCFLNQLCMTAVECCTNTGADHLDGRFLFNRVSIYKKHVTL